MGFKLLGGPLELVMGRVPAEVEQAPGHLDRNGQPEQTQPQPSCRHLASFGPI
jgi:hypothetical protein